MIYGYVRVSSITQNIERQMEEMYNNGLCKKQIFIDKESGKDFNRTNYQKLKKKIKKDDLLIIKSIDRLGRNYDAIIEEWSYLTKTIGCDIYVIDFPLLDTRVKEQNLMGRFIADVVLQVLSFIAQNERENIRARQAEGIKIAKEKGIHLGRPKYKLPDNFYEIANIYNKKEISLTDALKLVKMHKSTFLKYAK